MNNDSHDMLASLVPFCQESAAIFVALSPCYNHKKSRDFGKYMCPTCHVTDDEQFWIFQNDPYNPCHFHFANWEKKLPSKEVKGG